MKGRFIGELHNGWLPDSDKHAVVDQEFAYITKNGLKLIVEKGTITDGASIPWFFRFVFHIAPWGKHRRAAVLHDDMYQEGVFTRKQADEVFYEAMLVSGVSKWRAGLMFAGVRIGGSWAWYKHRWNLSYQKRRN